MGYLALQKKTKRDGVIAWALFAFLAFLSCAPFLWQWGWFWALPALYRLQYVIVTAILTVWTGSIARFRVMTLMMLLCLMNFSLIAADTVLFDRPNVAEEKMATLYVRTIGETYKDADKLIRDIRAETPDIVVLTQVPGIILNEMNRLKRVYPYRQTFTYNDLPLFTTIILYKDRPDSAGKIVASDLPVGPFIQFSPRGEPMALVSAYLFAPDAKNKLPRLKKQVAALADFARDSKAPVLMTGNFQTPSWMPYLDPLFYRGALRAQGGLIPTTPSYLPWFMRIPTVPLYAHRGIRVHDVRFLDSFGAPDRPFIATLAFN